METCSRNECRREQPRRYSLYCIVICCTKRSSAERWDGCKDGEHSCPGLLEYPTRSYDAGTNKPTCHRPTCRNLPVSGGDDELLYLTHSDFQNMMDTAMLRFEENIMRRLLDEMIRNTMENPLEIATKKRGGKLLDLSTELWKILSSKL